MYVLIFLFILIIKLKNKIIITIKAGIYMKYIHIIFTNYVWRMFV